MVAELPSALLRLPELSWQLGAELGLTLAYLQIKALGAKTLPLLLCLCWPRRGRTREALAWTAVGLVVASIWWASTPPVRAAFRLLLMSSTLLYYTAACALAFKLRAALRRKLLGKGTLFGSLALLFVFAPAALLRRSECAELLIIGWSLTLSCYGCCVDTSRAGQQITLREFVFFSMVDPTLSYPDRSRASSKAARAEYLPRVLLGASMMSLGALAATHVQLRAWLATGSRIDNPLGVVMAACFVFLVAYWMRAGAAHVWIGLMAALGYRTPECFCAPYAATSPLDFWRRWNTWGGQWVRRYLFVPWALSLARAQRRWRVGGGELLARGAAVLLSFAAMGLLHDWLIFSNHGSVDLVYSRMFVVAGVGALGWEALAARLRGLLACEGSKWWIAAHVGTFVYVSGLFVAVGALALG